MLASRYLTLFREKANSQRLAFLTLPFFFQLLILAGTFFFINKVFAVESEKELPCSELSGTMELNSLYFFSDSPESKVRQSALISEIDSAFSWLEVKMTGNEISLHNRRGGVGLPLSIYHLKVESYNAHGELASESALISDDFCHGLSMFPGSRTEAFKIPQVLLGTENDRRRIKIRIQASPF